MKSILFFVTIIFSTCVSKSAVFSITQPYAMSNAIEDSARVQIVSFDFSNLLNGLDPSQLVSIDWTVRHDFGATSIQLSSDSPSGSHGTFTHYRWINVFSGLNGFAIPTGNDPQSRLWLNSVTESFEVTLANSPIQFSYLPEQRIQIFSDPNASLYAQYFQPFEIEVVASQAIGNWGLGLGNPQPPASIDPAAVSGEITIRITTIPEPSSTALIAAGMLSLAAIRRRRR